MATNSTFIETLQLDGSVLLAFSHNEMSGYVGETVIWTTAQKVDLANKIIEDVTYEQLREIYKGCKYPEYNKAFRIKLWQQIKTMSPETIEANNAASTAEAIAIVQ